MWRTSDFRYDLPSELIAQRPLEQRSDSRMLVVNGENGVLEDILFKQLSTLLNKHDLLIFNDTRVVPARLYGHKSTGGRLEILLERIIDERIFLAQLSASKTPRCGTTLHVDAGVAVEVIDRQDEFFVLQVASQHTALEVFQQHGHTPLPPYISRADDAQDSERYQTVYARYPGAIAAPTAGLHFDENILSVLANKGVKFSFVTLHVGAGTFQPVRTEHIHQHRMHAEYVQVSDDVCNAVRTCHHQGGRVIAVGTTSVRALESAAHDDGQLSPFKGDTRLFITPGFGFRVVDGLVTNFHLPQSSLLMLVAAFAGYEHIMAAYRHAVEHRYRFYSYGDAMFVSIDPAARVTDQ